MADAKLLKVLAQVAKAPAQSLASCTRRVVYIADPVVAPDEKAAAALEEALEALRKVGIEAVAFEALRARGAAEAEAAGGAGGAGAAAGGAAHPHPPTHVPPSPDDVAVVMFTSGTTGLPKGVLISHANIVAAAGGLSRCIAHPALPSDVRDAYLAYLPLAHIMEMVAEINAFAMGSAVGYGSPHTLTPTGVKMYTKGAGPPCEGDAAVLRPTYMVFAPAVLDKVYAGLKAKIAAQSPTVQRLFASGLASGAANFERGVVGASWLYNALVFKKVQALLGGRVKLMVTGSAPLAPTIQQFVQSVFCCPVRQGYGLTETCAGTCVADPSDNAVGVVGPPTASACVMLRDWAEGSYLTADAHNPDIGMPRGEILIGGPAVCQGYLVDPASPDPEVVKKNAEEFVVDAKGRRWFCTGDIGQITPAGVVQIVDRKKDLVKLQQGEYVALSKVENALKNCALVELPMCFGRSTESFCVALVCPQPAALRALGAELGLDVAALGHAGLCREAAVVAEVSRRCLAACKGARLVGFEVPRTIGLVADPWTPENDLLTAAMKLKRVPIVARHKAQLDALYS